MNFVPRYFSVVDLLFCVNIHKFPFQTYRNRFVENKYLKLIHIFSLHYVLTYLLYLISQQSVLSEIPLFSRNFSQKFYRVFQLFYLLTFFNIPPYFTVLQNFTINIEYDISRILINFSDRTLTTRPYSTTFVLFNVH